MRGLRFCLLCLLAIFFITDWSYAADFVVDSLGDADDGNSYTAGDGTNTLRKCIRLANTTFGPDTINFDVSGIIAPASSLPPITDDGTVIDASSRWDGTWPGGRPGIHLKGSGNTGWHGLTISGVSYCQIRGLFITDFKSNLFDDRSGIMIKDGSHINTIGGTDAGYRNVLSGNNYGLTIHNSNDNTVIGNYIGTDVTGTASIGNMQSGIAITGGSQRNVIGEVGTIHVIFQDLNSNGRWDPGEPYRWELEYKGNVISGNIHNGVAIVHQGTDNNRVIGNYIGTDVNGTADLGNAGHGVVISDGAKSNVIGGNTTIEGNIISGNNTRGVNITGAGTNENKVSGNYIGTNASGNAALGNSRCGVGIASGAQSNVIGGPSEAERNVISANGGQGVRIVNPGTNNNIVSMNYIGTSASGTANLGNTENGVFIHDGAQFNIAVKNIIAYSGINGIKVENVNTDYNNLTQNSIHNNTNYGIDLLNGGNDEVPAPTMTSGGLDGNILSVSGFNAGADSIVEIFKADSLSSGEGMTYLGNLAASSTGNFSGSINVAGSGLSIGDPIVATTTYVNRNTSEFSTPFETTIVTTQCCQLREGWNLVSFRVKKCFYYGTQPAGQPGCLDFVNVGSLGFASLADWFSWVLTPGDAWSIVIGADGAMDRGLPPIFHTLGYMAPQSGYWIKIEEGTGGASLCIDGQLFDPACPIPLLENWNMVGYPLATGYYDTDDQPIVPGVTNWVKVDPPVAAYVFKSIGGKYSIIIGENGAYDPALPAVFSSIHYIAPCQAFWIKMNSEADLIYSQMGPAQ